MDITLNGGFNDTRNYYRVDSIHTVSGTPTTSNGLTTIAETGTTAKAGDTFKAETGPLAGQELKVVSATANSFTIASSVAPASGNTFYLLRPVTSRTNPDGTLIASVQSGSTQFDKNGVSVTVNQDTTTPANSRPLPVRQYNSDGTSVDGPTAAGQTAANASLSSVDSKTPAIEYAATGTITGTGAVSGTNITTKGLGTLGVCILGTWSGLVAVQGRVAGSTQWQLVPIYDYGSRTAQSYISTTDNATARVGGFQEVRLFAATWASGTGNANLGLNNGAAPQPVLSSDPAGFYSTTNLRDGSSNAITSTGSALDVNIKTASDISASGTLTAVNDSVVISTQGEATVVYELLGSLVGTFNFEASNNGFTTSQPVAAVYLGGIATQASSFSTLGFYSVLAAGFKQLRVRLSAVTSGSASVLANSTQGNRVSVALQGNPNNLQTLATQGPAGASPWLISTTNGATSANQTSELAKLDSIIANTANLPTVGQKTMAGSQPVTIASDQSAIPVSSPDMLITGAAAQTTAGNNVLLSSAGSAWLDVSGYRSATVQMVSTGTGGTFILEGSNDGVNAQPIQWYNQLIPGTPLVSAVTATNTQLIYTFPIKTRYVRVRIATAITGGSLQTFSRISQESWSPAVQTVYNSTAANLNATVSGTVALGAGSASIGSIKTAGKAAGTPTRLDYGATNVTTAAYVQVVAGCPVATELHIFDSGGNTLYLATGLSGSEVLLCMIPPGGDMLPIAVSAGTRLSVKAVAVNSTVGELVINYLN